MAASMPDRRSVTVIGLATTMQGRHPTSKNGASIALVEIVMAKDRTDIVSSDRQSRLS
jgi:hypothetical protein